jgi:hypothetical protein
MCSRIHRRISSFSQSLGNPEFLPAIPGVVAVLAGWLSTAHGRRR